MLNFADNFFILLLRWIIHQKRKQEYRKRIILICSFISSFFPSSKNFFSLYVNISVRYWCFSPTTKAAKMIFNHERFEGRVNRFSIISPSDNFFLFFSFFFLFLMMKNMSNFPLYLWAMLNEMLEMLEAFCVYSYSFQINDTLTFYDSF
jgi:hypothetical protein